MLTEYKKSAADSEVKKNVYDTELAEAAADGSHKARREIAERLMKSVRTTVRYVSGNHRDQDDFVQLALVEILRSLAVYRGESSLEGWATKIAYRVAMRNLKIRHRRDQAVSLTPERSEGVTTGFEERQDRIWLRQKLAELMGKVLSDDRRTALVLRLVHGYSVEEISKITGAKANTVRNRLRDARRIMRGQLNKDPAFCEWAKQVKI